MPPERLMSFLRVRVCGGYGGPPGVSRAARVCCFVVVLLSLASGSPRVAVFVEVRVGRRGIPGNVLLSEIYILALSEPPLQRVSSEKDAQSCPETGISSLVRGREFRSWRIKKIQHLRRLCIKVRPDLRGLFRYSSAPIYRGGPASSMPVHRI